MWATREDVRNRWADGEMIADELLDEMIASAHVQCVAYAPVLADGADVPPNYRDAEVAQVRANYTNSKRDGDVLGFGDGFAVRVRPLGEDVKALLRPRRGKPRVR